MMVNGTPVLPPTLDRNSLYYLASPYSKYPGGTAAAFAEVCRISAKLVSQGWKVFSPIAHSHPIATFGGLDALSHELWLGLDVAFLARCDGMIVVQMDGWQESYGVQWEINWWRQHKGREPIYVNS